MKGADPHRLSDTLDVKEYIIRKIFPEQRAKEDKAVTFASEPLIVVTCPYNDYVKFAFDHAREQAKMFRLLMLLMPSMANKSYNKRLQILNSFQEREYR
jgi:hypothetical protein